MADPTLTTEVQPQDYSQKKFIEINPTAQGWINDLAGVKNQGLTLNQAYNQGSIGGLNSQQRNVAAQFLRLGADPNATIGSFLNTVRTDPSTLEKLGIGKGYSYLDLAKEAAASNPNFDPNDPQSLNSLAAQISQRGLTNTNREDIKTLATNLSLKNQIDRAQNPQNYITDQQKTQNQQTAQSLISQIYGADQAQDPHLVDFISQQLSQGVHPYELSQFLTTTPQYLQKQAETENQRVQQESLNARNALDQQLQQSQQEVFARAQPSIIASFMRAGRLNSSGLNSALAQAQADLERERQGFLANAGYNDAIRSQGYNRENFVNNQNAAFNQYMRQSEPSYQQRFAVQNAGNYANFQAPYDQLARQYQVNDMNTQRQWQIDDYNRQSNDYFRALDQQRNAQRAALPYQLFGSLAGAGLQGWAAGGFKGF